MTLTTLSTGDMPTRVEGPRSCAGPKAGKGNGKGKNHDCGCAECAMRKRIKARKRIDAVKSRMGMSTTSNAKSDPMSDASSVKARAARARAAKTNQGKGVASSSKVERDPITGKMKSARAKVGGECSSAMSSWKLHGMTPSTAATLAKCRAMARQRSLAHGTRIAGNEARAQHWEHRVKLAAEGKTPITAKERLAKAKALRAQRAAKVAGGTASQSQPALTRPDKGTRVERIARLKERSKARYDQAQAQYKEMRQREEPEYRRLQEAVRRAKSNKPKREAELKEFEARVSPTLEANNLQGTTAYKRFQKFQKEERIARAAARSGGSREQAIERQGLADQLRYKRRKSQIDPYGTGGKYDSRHSEYAGRTLDLPNETYKVTAERANQRITDYWKNRLATRAKKHAEIVASRQAEAAKQQEALKNRELEARREERATTRETPESLNRAKIYARSELADKRNARYQNARDKLNSLIGRGAPHKPTAKTTALGREFILAKRAEHAVAIRKEHRKVVESPIGQMRIAEQRARATARDRKKFGLFGGRLPGETGPTLGS